MTIFGSSQINNPGNLGTKLFQPRGGGAPVVSWWNPDGATPAGVCIGAYQAKAAANYAASKVNLPTPGVNDLVEGNGAVPWAAGTGWGFVAAAAQYFDTALLPVTGWSMLAQFANAQAFQMAYIVGEASALVGGSFRVMPNGGGFAFYWSGGGQIAFPDLLAGNIGMGGAQGYRNGAADAAPVGPWTRPAGGTLYIGCQNNAGVAGNFITADCYAVAIYNVILTAPQMLARANAMAAL